MYNYSVIIPHYNNVEDLQRCLNCIPNRDDVQIIVVDDNSDRDKVDIKKFPGVGCRNTDVIFSNGENGKGPGYARNVGLNHAKGKWIIFCDSDDYLLPEVDAAMDEFVNCEVDVAFFKCQKQNVDGLRSEYLAINDLIEESKMNGTSDAISYGFPCPWGKFIKRNFLLENNIRFQQITGGDDILFSVRVAISLKHYILSDTRLYCVVDRPGSLTRNNQWKGFYSYTLACCEAYKLMEPVGEGILAFSWIASWWGRLRAENKIRASLLFPRVMWTMGFIKSLRCYRKAMKEKKWNWKNRES